MFKVLNTHSPKVQQNQQQSIILQKNPSPSSSIIPISTPIKNSLSIPKESLEIPNNNNNTQTQNKINYQNINNQNLINTNSNAYSNTNTNTNTNSYFNTNQNQINYLVQEKVFNVYPCEVYNQFLGKKMKFQTNIPTNKKSGKNFEGRPKNKYTKSGLNAARLMDRGIKEGRWTEEEHRKFVEGIVRYGNEWRMVQRHVATRTSNQARSHAQKFFLKLKKIKIPSLGINLTLDSIRTLNDVVEHINSNSDHDTERILIELSKSFAIEPLKKKKRVFSLNCSDFIKQKENNCYNNIKNNNNVTCCNKEENNMNFNFNFNVNNVNNNTLNNNNNSGHSLGMKNTNDLVIKKNGFNANNYINHQSEIFIQNDIIRKKEEEKLANGGGYNNNSDGGGNIHYYTRMDCGNIGMNFLSPWVEEKNGANDHGGDLSMLFNYCTGNIEHFQGFECYDKNLNYNNRKINLGDNLFSGVGGDFINSGVSNNFLTGNEATYMPDYNNQNQI